MTLLDLITKYVREYAHRCEVASDNCRTVVKCWFLGQKEPRHFLVVAPRTDAVLTAIEVHEVRVNQWPPARNNGGQMMLSL